MTIRLSVELDFAIDVTFEHYVPPSRTCDGGGGGLEIRDICLVPQEGDVFPRALSIDGGKLLERLIYARPELRRQIEDQADAQWREQLAIT